jgi:membrane protein YqaA with SNARE-associated domain
MPVPDELPAPSRGVSELEPKVWVFGAVLVVIAIIALVLMFRDFSSQSYLYLAFYAIPANSAVSVFPHEPVVIFFGKNGSLLLTALAASAGTLIAGFLDHTVFVPVMNLAALSGYKEKAWYQKAARLFLKYPFTVIVVAGFTPIPFFPFKFLSFSVNYPLWRYLGALLTGRFPRYFLLAWLGRVLNVPNWAILLFFLLIINIYFVKVVPKVWRSLRTSLRQRKEAK